MARTVTQSTRPYSAKQHISRIVTRNSQALECNSGCAIHREFVSGLDVDHMNVLAESCAFLVCGSQGMRLRAGDPARSRGGSGTCLVGIVIDLQDSGMHHAAGEPRSQGEYGDSHSDSFLKSSRSAASIAFFPRPHTPVVGCVSRSAELLAWGSLSLTKVSGALVMA